MNDTKTIKIQKLITENPVDLYPETSAGNVKVKPKNNIPFFATNAEKLFNSLHAVAFNGISGIPEASEDNPGMMSVSDKVKLDGIHNEATKTKINQIINNGTEIASIEINNEETKIFSPTIPTSLPASNTTNTYTSGGTDPVSGRAVTEALNTLNVSKTGGEGKYIQAISENSGKIFAKEADMPTSLPASDVSDWAKAPTKPNYTAPEVGAIDSSLKGVANGVAELDSTGKVPVDQLPNGVSISLGITHDQAYYGDLGKIAYDHSQDASAHARTDATNTTFTQTQTSGTEVGTITVNGTNTKIYTPTIPDSLPASNTVSTYSATGTDPVNGKAVTQAINTLSSDIYGGAGKYISKISETNGIISATAVDMPRELPASNTTDIYSTTGTDPISGKALYSALSNLSVSSAGGEGKYIKAISQENGKISVTAATFSNLPSSITYTENEYIDDPDYDNIH